MILLCWFEFLENGYLKISGKPAIGLKKSQKFTEAHLQKLYVLISLPLTTIKKLEKNKFKKVLSRFQNEVNCHYSFLDHT